MNLSKHTRTCRARLAARDPDSAKVGTMRSCLEAVGGRLSTDYVLGDQRIQVA